MSAEDKGLDEVAAKFGEIFDSLVSKFKNDGVLTQSSTIEKFLPEIKKIAAEVGKTLGDGFQWTDVVDLVRIARPLMILVKDVEDLSGEEKRAFVKEAIWVAYKTYDDGPTGNENNIDIPYLFGPFERKVEAIVVPMLAEVAVSVLHPELKERGLL